MPIDKTRLLVALGLAACLALPTASPSEAAAGNPFDKLKGDWKGGGTVETSGGEPRKVACKVTYNVSGSTMTQHMRCAGDDYRINATTKMTDKGGRIRGSWSESVYAASGGVSGRAKDDTIRARISGDRLSSRMSIKISETDHSIYLLQLNEKTGTYRLVGTLTFQR